VASSQGASIRFGRYHVGTRCGECRLAARRHFLGASGDLLDFEVTAPSLDLWPQTGILSPDFNCSLHFPVFPDHRPLQFSVLVTRPLLATGSGIRSMWALQLVDRPVRTTRIIHLKGV